MQCNRIDQVQPFFFFFSSQALSKKFQKELMNRDQEIQQLTANLGKKDLELQALEARLNAAEEQHREALQTMRKMLAEKDKTIEVSGWVCRALLTYQCFGHCCF